MKHGEIIRALKEFYAIDGEVAALPGELDLNYDVRAGGARYVFKAMRPDCDPAFIDMQIQAMRRVASSGLAGIAPAVIPTKDGEDCFILKNKNGETRRAWMISFLPGALMAETSPYTAGLAENIGETLARLDHALEGFSHPLLDRPQKWDLQQAGWISNHIDAVDDPAHRKHIGKVAARYADDLAPRLSHLPKTPIHNDANDMNILVRNNDRKSVSGIIDFGDMTRAPRICEVAIALAYAMMGDGDGLARAKALVSGYNSVSALSENECALILPLVETRLAVSVTNAAIQRRENPQNEYLSISEAPAWRLLESLQTWSEKTAFETFTDACAGKPTDGGKAASGRGSLAARRAAASPHNQKLSYHWPLHLVRGEGHFLYDSSGAQYLDAYNNVPHVGHANPHVVEAVRRQMSLLNTNTRYLQDMHVDYAERMIALLPDPLTKIVFLNSASEANELALRLARAVTGARDMVVMDHGYHGGTTGAMDISPYKFNHPDGAGGPPDWVHIVPQPDVFRGRHRGADAGARYIDDARTVFSRLQNDNRKIAGFICECLPSVGGQIVLPDGYLNALYAMTREAGGVAIADDVQTGLGRLGDFFWGFDQQSAIPDVAVFGKPLGNGFPLAAVAMTDEIAAAFAQGPEFFSTFGGSSAACAAGNAVLDVLETNDMPAKAKKTGAALHEELTALAERFPLVGDVRGFGFFIGVDLVDDRDARTPATAQAAYVKNRMREECILIGVEGPAENVLKIRPPMTFDDAASERLIATLASILAEPGAAA